MKCGILESAFQIRTGLSNPCKAWDKVSTNSNFKLSDVLDHYYGQTVPNDNDTNPSHYTKRFRIFCKANDLLDANGNFLLTDSKRNELINRIKVFTLFYYNSLDPTRIFIELLGNFGKKISKFKGAEVAFILFNNLSTIKISYDWWKKDFSSNYSEVASH